MAWLILFIAGLFETGWPIGLKYTDGFSRFVGGHGLKLTSP